MVVRARSPTCGAAVNEANHQVTVNPEQEPQGADWVADDERIASVARLLRAYDDAVQPFGVPAVAAVTTRRYVAAVGGTVDLRRAYGHLPRERRVHQRACGRADRLRPGPTDQRQLVTPVASLPPLAEIANRRMRIPLR